jgi:predicted nuclease of predicted toxin-antitoxin system
MKLLLDANISWRLCASLSEQFGECAHVNKTALPYPAKDFEIWKYAKENGYIVVTQDTDFLYFLETKGYPPQIILIKTGNMNRHQLEKIILQAKQAIIEFSRNEEHGLLEIV